MRFALEGVCVFAVGGRVRGAQTIPGRGSGSDAWVAALGGAAQGTNCGFTLEGGGAGLFHTSDYFLFDLHKGFAPFFALVCPQSKRRV